MMACQISDSAKERCSADTEIEELHRHLAPLEAVRRSDLVVSRQSTSVDAWYQVYDPLTFRHHRLSVIDYQMFAEIQPGRKLGDCFQRLVDRHILQASDAEQFYSWIVQLNRLGMISLPVDTGTLLYRRAVEKQRLARRPGLAGILFYRLPLFSPDAFLRRTVHLVSPLFSRVAVVLWLAAMVCSVLYVWRHLPELADPFGGATASRSAILMVVLLVILKGVHEFGHAYACRHFGGAVPEMGLFFIVFTPCAYVNASASWSFSRRHRRIVVALAGMYFESIAAMGALLMWAFSGPSLVREAAQQALILATVVTVGFNINPLMKFDGYYVLADLLGIPELRGNALREWNRYLKRCLYGVRLPSLATSRRGSIGLAVFGCLVSAYKLTVILGICVLIMQLPLVGPPLGLFFLLSVCWRKLWKFVRYTLSSRELNACRLRAVTVAALLVVAAAGVLLTMPTPGMTSAQGVVRYQSYQTLYAPDHGQLESVDVEPGQMVAIGQPVCRLVSSQLRRESQQQSAVLAAAALDARSAVGRTPAEYAAAVAKLDLQTARQQNAMSNLQSLMLLAPVPGRILESSLLQRPGVWIREGAPVAVIGHGRRIVEASISEQTAPAALPTAGDSVEVYVAGQETRLLTGEVLEISPVARPTSSFHGEASGFRDSMTLGAESNLSQDASFSLRVLLHDCSDLPATDGIRAVVKLQAQQPVVGVSAYRACCRFRDSLLMAR